MESYHNKNFDDPFEDLDGFMHNQGYQEYDEVADNSPAQIQDENQDEASSTCCLCGQPMLPNPSNQCITCLKKHIDFTEKLQKVYIVVQCKACKKYMKNQYQWRKFGFDTKVSKVPEFVNFVLKNASKSMKGYKLQSYEILSMTDKSLVLKVMLDFQLEGSDMTTSCDLTFTHQYGECKLCHRRSRPEEWLGKVRVRQNREACGDANAQMLMMYLEQLILKNNVIDEKCMRVERQGAGGSALAFDFHYLSKSHILGLASFLRNSILCKATPSKQLLSHDIHSNIFTYRHSLSIEIVPLCPLDLCLLPKNIMKDSGGLGPLVLVYKISKYIHILDAFNSQKTIRTYEIDQAQYHNSPFMPLVSRDRLTEFQVINIEADEDNDFNTSRTALRFKFRFVKVEIRRCSDHKEFVVNSHLGEQLDYNDIVLGYDLTQINCSSFDHAYSATRGMPDVIIAKKVYPLLRAAQEIRYWRLAHFNDAQPEEKMYTDFMEDLEEDPVLRSNVNLHKLPEKDPLMQKLEHRITEISPTFEVKETKKSKKFQKELDRWLQYGVAPDSYQHRLQSDKDINEKWRVQNLIILQASLQQWQSPPPLEEDFPQIRIQELCGVEKEMNQQYKETSEMSFVGQPSKKEIEEIGQEIFGENFLEGLDQEEVQEDVFENDIEFKIEEINQDGFQSKF